MSKSKIQNPKSKNTSVCLTIAGLDPSGGAGIIADIKTFSAFGCFAAAAVTSVTFQNSTGVFGAVHQTANSVRRQIETVIDDCKIGAVKTGMLPTRKIIETVADLIENCGLKNVVVDPVIKSTSGFELIETEALAALIERLFPLATLITPNIPEAERISGIAIETSDDIREAAAVMRSMGAKNVLIKGGHFVIEECGMRNADLEDEDQRPKTNDRKATDYLFIGDNPHVFEAEFIDGVAVRGTGCMLSAAIAANLANGKDLVAAVHMAKDFVTKAIQNAL